MEGIGPLSMNIIDDDITPVRATPASRGAFASCTARGLTVARASVQPPESPPSHWQADYNRVIAHDYQEFMTESIAKRRRLEAVHFHTFEGTISLSIPPETSDPNLLEILKASEVEDNSKVMEDRYRLVMARATKERNKAATTVPMQQREV